MPKTEAGLVPHAAADVFPRMRPAEYDGLKADIQANGVQFPIVLHEGRIVDGRHRYQACRELGIDCPTQEWSGKGSLVGFIYSANKHRRHLDSSQLAMVAAELLPYLEAESKVRQEQAGERGKEGGRGKTKPLAQDCAKGFSSGDGKAAAQAAELMGTSTRYVEEAKKLKRDAPELAAKVRDGELTLPQAKAALSPPPPKKISETFYANLSLIRQHLSGIRDQYGSVTHMFASPLWRNCDIEPVIEMTGLLHESLGKMHKEMLAYAKNRKAKA